VLQWWVRVSVRRGVTSASFRAACSCRTFLKAWPDGPRVDSVSMSDRFMAMRWRGMETPDALAATRYRFPCVWQAGTPVGARKTSVGIQSGIQGWRFNIGKRGKLAAAYDASRLMARLPSILLPIGCNLPPLENQTLARLQIPAFAPVRRTPESGARNPQKTSFNFPLDAKIPIANLWFLEYAFPQKHIRL